MDRRGTYIIAGIIIVAIAFFIVISFQKSSLDTAIPDPESASSTEWANTPAEPAKPPVLINEKTIITAKHAYQNGQHIIAGEIPLPTPCHILESKASTENGKILVDLTYSIKTGEMCADVITPARFKVTVKGDKNMKATATLNGIPVTLNLLEAGPNENLDDFELYIKG